jgi:nucleoside-diphosphate-sugar epimerase
MTIRQITVFGGSGFVGRAVVQALAREGYMIRVATRRIGLANPVKAFGDVGQITLLQANLRMPRSVALAVAGSDAVINAAGIGVQAGRQTYKAVHADGARNIAEAATAAGVQRLIHVSGIGADNRSSRNAYIASKVAAEDAIVRGFTNATIFRPSVVFGPTTRCSTAWPASPPRRRSCRDRRRLGQGPAGVRRRCRRAPSPRAGAPDTPRACSSWAARASTAIARSPPRAARDRPPQADHRRAGRPDEDRRLVRQQIARRLCRRSPPTRSS